VVPTYALSWFQNKGCVDEHHYCVFTGQHRAPQVTPPLLLAPPNSADKVQGRLPPMQHAEGGHEAQAVLPPATVQNMGLATSQELRALPRENRYRLLQLRLAAYSRAYGEVAPVGMSRKMHLHGKQAHPVAWSIENKLAARFLTEWG
jgi:hypothetical protein